MILDATTILNIFVGVVAADLFMNLFQYLVNKYNERKEEEFIQDLVEGYQ